MAGPGPEVIVRGDETLALTMAAAAQKLGDMSTPGRQTASFIQARGSSAAPRRTGRLASSLRAATSEREAEVTSTLVYAPVIHWGWPGHSISPNPFLLRAAESTQTTWVDWYARRVEDVVGTIRGL